MEQPSFYLGQTHEWSGSDVISSYKEIRKHLYICQENLREEHEQKVQKKFRKNSSHSKQLSQKAARQAQQSQRGRSENIGSISKQLKQQKEESALRAEEKRLIRMKNALWRRMGSSICVEKGNKLVPPKSLECSSLYRRNDTYSEQQKKCLANVTYSKSYMPHYNRFLRNRQIIRKIRNGNTINSTLSYFRQLPQQNTNDLFTNQIFNGITNF